MRIMIAILLMLVVLSVPCLALATPQTQIILAGNYWDGVADEALGYTEIAVVDGKIVEVGKHINHPEDAKIIDLTNEFVMPGFIDCHLHITGSKKIMANFAASNDTALTLSAVDACDKLLNNGFTTIRDAGDFSIVSEVVPVLKKAIASGDMRGPKIISGGHALSAVGGHFDFAGLLRDGIVMEQASVAEGVEGVRRAVYNEVRHGADWIKFASSGGFLSPSDGPEDVSYSQEEMNAIVAAAHDLGKYAFAHAYGDEAVRRAVTAGVRSVEHGNFSSAETLRMVADKGIYLVPTQYAVVRTARETSEGRVDMSLPEFAREKDIKYCHVILDSAHNLANSDVKIAFGTDLGTFDFTTNGAVEFAEMQRNGISTLRALKAATSMAAELLELNTGSIANGKCADIVAMPGNPFDDISVTEKVNFVMKDGVVYRSAE